VKKGGPVSLSPLEVVQQFNDCFNRGDLAGLSALMAEDHTFIDSSSAFQAGRAHMVAGWKEFFAS
jgi:ketosteroid isomerase-like protein